MCKESHENNMLPLHLKRSLLRGLLNKSHILQKNIINVKWFGLSCFHAQAHLVFHWCKNAILHDQWVNTDDK